MALTGLAIYKLLPKTNCKECGQATCLAFAMQIAAGKAGLDTCPHVSAEARETLSAASEPPVALVRIGAGENALEIGNETVLFRHDKRFVHPTGIGIIVPDTLDDGVLAEQIGRVNRLSFDRLGQIHGVDLLAVRHESGDPERYVRAVRAAAVHTPLNLVLLCAEPGTAERALEAVGERKPLLHAAHAENLEAMVALARRYDLALAVRGRNLEELAELSGRAVQAGHKQLVLDSGARDVGRVLADQTQIRRLAVNKRFRPFGFPTICLAAGENAVLDAAVYIGKYAAVVLLETADPADLLPLITWRLNVYTDPQKPIAIEAKVYEVGNPGPEDPVFLTTNFSLTYFCVRGDVEAARVPAYILPVDTDGTSVLTAWAAGKMTPEKIGTFLESSGITKRVQHRRLIIPGGLAVLSGKLREVTGWEVLVGPRESAAIPAFLREYWSR
ncbi:acetyl-CoA decarbonylase/synthase complex subunit gamma [Candidatus Desulforudis audaxviator]|uniref:CO dehydrogenase/acetyl-CoA synthase delta subunit n=1 Tax=Desulforudis audaxviator (strain MP104C) TaxID=477974 RepID=B1I319_DESAP|nr:acetyl-CoA decarbonylase/synthase complex subunit gamma [Candidatus Desulforudis audaxviator]ACA59385.1 CO dehydrogenase/acetyl-CoA synthase delta subunit [Candidatus Desulforudis audaxviator MP104C]AZK59365.1 CO dehydrogenase/acetyl-CoA synthase gamma subunit (corrinoid Fe-S protein) [Candidatus Desulforudis audaxviator]